MHDAPSYGFWRDNERISFDSDSMETAMLRSLMLAVPDVDEPASQKIDELCAVSRKFFEWEMEALRRREPTQQEMQDHRDGLQMLVRLTKLLRKLGEDKRLRALQIRLNESWETFHNPMSDEEADAIFGQIAK